MDAKELGEALVDPYLSAQLNQAGARYALALVKQYIEDTPGVTVAGVLGALEKETAAAEARLVELERGRSAP